MSSPLFRSLCESLTGAEIFSDLRMIRLSSEKAYKADADLYKKYFPPTCILSNALSSSETNLLTTFCIDHNTKIAGRDLPVGYPVEEKEISLRDDTGHRLGCNQIGEIVVRSKYLSPGYWNNQDLTRAKFKPDPHDSEKQNYYTGDLGLMLPDGCLIHKGRKDARIKIRGYGVDLNEVEAALRGHKAIRDAVVVDRKDKSGETRLVAYFTSLTELATTTDELRQYLGTLLADYMIPAAFVRMEVLPLTPNNKLDRKALPEPDRQRPNLGTHYSAPQNETEEGLAQIWEEVLDVHPIGIHDNFFDLGGHSLAAMCVISRVLRHFQLEIPLTALLQSPTVAEMAAVIKGCQDNKLSGKALEQALTELESLSDDEAQKRLSESSSAVVKKE